LLDAGHGPLRLVLLPHGPADRDRAGGLTVPAPAGSVRPSRGGEV
jgi:hypothetical protein